MRTLSLPDTRLSHKAIGRRLLLGIAVFFLGSPLVSAQALAPDNGYAPGELLVKFKKEIRPRGKASTRAARNVHLKAEFPSVGVEHWALPADAHLLETLEQLRADPNVEFAEPNYRRYPRAKLPNESQSTLGNVLARLKQINAPAAWDVVTDASNVIVAVIDDGFDMTHPDLKSNYYAPRDVLDDDNDPGYETISKSNETCIDEHGTEVAGALGAVGDNGIGISGVAWKLKLMPIRVGCFYQVSDIVKAVIYAKEEGAHIINISWGGPQFSETESQVLGNLLESDILVVAAAGNFAVDNDRVPDFPSGLAWPNIISVAAVDDNNVLANFTQYGATSVDVAAPGTDVWSTLIGGEYTTATRLLGGTSFSAPYVAGVAALVKAKNPTATFRDLKGAIMSSVDPLIPPTGASSYAATGRLATDGVINAKSALDAMTNRGPLFVINKVLVDDSAGNKNGLVDPGETVMLAVSLENVWDAASNVSVTLALDSAVPDAVNDATVLTSPALLAQVSAGELATKSFSVKIASSIVGRKVIPFTVKLVAGQKTQTRRFRLEMGTLKKGVSVSGKARPPTDPQDEFHFYHIDVPANSENLVFELVPERQVNLDLMVRYNKPPEFDYASYEQKTLDDVAVGTLVQSSPPGVVERISIGSPRTGTYFATVVVPRDENKENIAYTFSANYGRKTPSAASGGCSLVRAESIDPMLPAMGLLAFWRVSRRRYCSAKGA